MKAQKTENGITVLQADCFNPRDILECGQIFRFDRDGEGNYRVFSLDKYAEIKKTNDGYFISTDSPDYFYDFFDLDRDYGVICEKLSSSYDVMKRAVEFGRGIRILRQNLEEMIFSFIISANNNIKRITGIVDRLCILAGEKHEGTTEYYSFPAPEAIAELTVEQLTAIGSGYRAPYIKDSAKMIADGYELETLRNVPTAAARKELLRFPGVGPKVADCVLLFSLGHADAFPLDVWMKRAMRLMYFQGAEPGKKAMEDQIAALGPNSGILQQYIFQYARENM